MTLQIVIPGQFANPDLPVLDTLGFRDTFDRPDSDSIGSTSSVPRKQWSLWPATISGIRNGEGFFSRTTELGGSIASIDAGTADGTLTATLGTLDTNQVGVAFRSAGGGANHLRFTRSGTVWRMERSVDNTGSVIDQVSGNPQSGDVLSVVMAGDQISCLVNGVEVLSVTETFGLDETIHGMYNSGSSLTTFREVSFTP